MVLEKVIAQGPVQFSAYMENGEDIEDAFGEIQQELSDGGPEQAIVFDIRIDSNWEQIADDAPISRIAEKAPQTLVTIVPSMSFDTFKQVVNIKQRLSNLIKIQSGEIPMGNITIASERNYLDAIIHFLAEHVELFEGDRREIFELYKTATMILTGLHLEKNRLTLGIQDTTIEDRLFSIYQGG